VFEDVTAAAGIELAAPSESAAFADVDADGDLDLFVAYQTLRTATGFIHPSKLYRNDGQGHFEDVTAASGIDNTGYCMAAVFGDFDGDGLPDLFLTNQFTPNRFYRNLGECASRTPPKQPAWPSRGTGSRSAFRVRSRPGRRPRLVRGAPRPRNRASHRALAVGRHGRGRDDAAVPQRRQGPLQRRDRRWSGLRRVTAAMGALGGDVDGDGWPEIFLSTGSEDLAALWPKLLFSNRGGTRFLDVSEAAGVGHLQKGSASRWPTSTTTATATSTSCWAAATSTMASATCCSRTQASARTGCAWSSRRELEPFREWARACASMCARATAERDIYDHVWPASSLGGSPSRREIGLGQAQAIAELEVRWPGPKARRSSSTTSPRRRTCAIHEDIEDLRTRSIARRAPGASKRAASVRRALSAEEDRGGAGRGIKAPQGCSQLRGLPRRSCPTSAPRLRKALSPRAKDLGKDVSAPIPGRY
jgi:hypothetical protein